MQNLEELKNKSGTLLENVKEIGGNVKNVSSKVFSEAKRNINKMFIENKIKKSKIKLGDMIYQLDIDTGVKEIDELKKKIKESLDELKILESKKSK